MHWSQEPPARGRASCSAPCWSPRPCTTAPIGCSCCSSTTRAAPHSGRSPPSPTPSAPSPTSPAPSRGEHCCRCGRSCDGARRRSPRRAPTAGRAPRCSSWSTSWRRWWPNSPDSSTASSTWPNADAASASTSCSPRNDLRVWSPTRSGPTRRCGWRCGWPTRRTAVTWWTRRLPPTCLARCPVERSYDWVPRGSRPSRWRSAAHRGPRDPRSWSNRCTGRRRRRAPSTIRPPAASWRRRSRPPRPRPSAPASPSPGAHGWIRCPSGSPSTRSARAGAPAR